MLLRPDDPIAAQELAQLRHEFHVFQEPAVDVYGLAALTGFDEIHDQLVELLCESPGVSQPSVVGIAPRFCDEIALVSDDSD